MFKSLIPVVFFLLITFSCAAASPTQNLIDSVLPTVVTIEYALDGDSNSACTGVVVEILEPKVLTAKHCVPNSPNAKVIVDETLEGTVIKTNDGLALISVPDLQKPRIKVLKEGNVKLAEEMFTFGYGLNRLTIFSRRVVWIVKGMIPDGAFSMDGPLLPGMSGGPVVNEKGELVGINQSVNPVDNPAIGRIAMFGVAAGPLEIREFLK